MTKTATNKTKPSPKEPSKKPSKQPKNKTKAILALATEIPTADIPAIVNTTKQAVYQTLQRHGIKPKRLELYQKHKADILAGMQVKILKHIDEDKLKSASVNNLAYAFQQFYNSERLERGKSLNNIEIHMDIAAIRDMKDKINMDENEAESA